MKNVPNIRNYTHLRNYVSDVLKLKQEVNARFSLRALARQLGYQNPSMLADIIAGRRKAGKLFISRLASVLELSERDTKAVERLATSPLGKRPVESASHFPLDKFRFIADWYHLVLLEFIKLKDFKSSPTHLSKRLIPQVNRTEISNAWDRLERLGLVVRDKNGEFMRDASVDELFIGENIKSDAIRLHHRQMLDLAKTALETRPLHERDVSGSTVAIRLEDLPRIKSAIYELHRILNEVSAPSGQAEAVYRLNVQLFRFDKED